MSDPVKSAEEFLAKKGYPFEMKVASLFQKVGMGIHQSVYYTDPNTGIAREMDIIAISTRKFANRHFSIVFVIECKHAESPWILLSSNLEAFPICYTYSSGAQQWMSHLSNHPDFVHFFEVERNFGYGLIQVYSKKDDTKENAYKAIQSVLSFLKSEKSQPRFAQNHDSVLYIPIIAIQGKLVKAALTETGSTVCTEISEAQIIYKEDISGVIPKIHVITEDNLEIYINSLVDDCNRLVVLPFMTDAIANPPFQSPISVVNTQPKYTL